MRPTTAQEKRELEIKRRQHFDHDAVEHARKAVQISPAEEISTLLSACPMIVEGLNDLTEQQFAGLMYRVRQFLKENQMRQVQGEAQLRRRPPRWIRGE